MRDYKNVIIYFLNCKKFLVVYYYLFENRVKDSYKGSEGNLIKLNFVRNLTGKVTRLSLMGRMEDNFISILKSNNIIFRKLNNYF